jgi:antitoxin component YwqK of YwqJK toxin-antitoxin module
MGRILIAFSCLLIVSCNGKNENEHRVLIEKDAKGNVTLRAPYHLSDRGDTLIDGTIVHYYANRNVEDSFQVNDGQKNGFYFQYDSLGALRSKMNFANGKREGLSLLFYPNTKPEVEELFRGDSLLYSKNFFSNGQLKSYFIFIDKTKSGYFLVYDSLGKKVDEGGDSNRIKKW